jgi:hypothetical protein
MDVKGTHRPFFTLELGEMALNTERFPSYSPPQAFAFKLAKASNLPTLEN